MRPSIYNLNKTLLFLKIFFFFPVIGYLCQTTLVDFGHNSNANYFGLAGWNELLISTEMQYTDVGPDGVILQSNLDEFTDYMGVRGTPKHFNVGERIVVTWYNNSDEVIFFTNRISFTDPNNPDEDGADGKWYTMRSLDDYRYTYQEIQPHSLAKTVFNITDDGVHKTDDVYSLVNINLSIEWYDSYMKQFLVCDKIELFNDADIQPPSVPGGINITPLSDSQIYVEWSPSTDNTETVEYLVYLNDEIEGYSQTTNYTIVYLEPSTEYNISVSAMDMCGNESARSNPITVSTNSYAHSNSLINPNGIEYIGSIDLSENFSWGGEALTYNPNGDGGQTGVGSTDGFPGTFFVMNLNQPEYGFVAEVSIPTPFISITKSIDELNQVTILQESTNIRPENVNNLEFVDIWRTGLEYIEDENRLYSTWNIYYTVTGEKHVTLSCCDAANLSTSQKFGAWFIGSSTEWPIDAALSDYLFSVPDEWASQNLAGRKLITGRFREGGLSGLGPTMYAFAPVGNNILPAESELEFSTLLEYASFYESNDRLNYYPNSINGYRHSDLWRDADWIQVNNQSSIVLIGNKARGEHYYGYYGERMRHDWIIADLPYPEFWDTDPDGKGWRSSNIIPMIIFYNPVDLAAAVNGDMEAYEPQPYAATRLNRNIFWGNRCEIFSACYDDYNNLLYIAEFVYELEGRIIVHAFRVNNITDVTENHNSLLKFSLNQNYPNPFNPSTKIKYTIPTKSFSPLLGGVGGGLVTLKVYDILGREIATLVNQTKSPGTYVETFHGSSLPSGIYFYKLNVGASKEMYSETKKMILLK